MLYFSGIKINLGLNVISKRADGYHNLESVFYPLPKHDIIEITENTEKDFELVLSGIPIPGMIEDNLIYKCWLKIKEHLKGKHIKVHLHKCNPLGAGLGAGSANAVTFLTSANQQFNLNLSYHELFNIALSLGSDCPYFLKNTPQFCEGRGEIMSDAKIDLSNYEIKIEKPDIHVSTKDAFAGIEPQQPKPSIKEIIQLPIEQWKGLLVNDFEKTVFKKFPEIEAVKNSMYEQGAIYASMSGSGSEVYGIFEKNKI